MAIDCKSISNTYIGSNPISFIFKIMVIIAQSVEYQTVTLSVMGSNPLFYPYFLKI